MYGCTCELLDGLTGEADSSLATSLRRRKSLAASRVDITEPVDLSAVHLARALEYGQALAQRASSNLSEVVIDPKPEENMSFLPTLRDALALDEELMWLGRALSLKQEEG